jgi:type II secretory pathway component PulM
MAIIQKAEDSMNKQVGSKIEDLAQNVTQLMAALPKPQSSGQAQGMMNAGSTRNDDGNNSQGGASDVSDLGLSSVQG